MGARIRAHDWADHPLGSASDRPQSLRTALRLLLNTGHPTYVFWGGPGWCFYNDAYSQSIGPERHPGSLGRPGREVWEEIWPIIGPQIAQVIAGRGATWHENALVPITRHGRREDVYWTGARLRSLLHHQAPRSGHRPGPVNDLRLRSAVRRPGAHPFGDGTGDDALPYLPRNHAAGSTDPSATEHDEEAMRGSGEVVLVIYDEPTIRMLIAEVLEEFGYAGIEASDGASGLRILQSTARIDLLITDVGLPGGMNGRQVADAARVMRPDLKVLFITGYAENAAIGNGHLDPGMEVLTKPFAMDALAQRIRGLVEA